MKNRLIYKLGPALFLLILLLLPAPVLAQNVFASPAPPTGAPSLSLNGLSQTEGQNTSTSSNSNTKAYIQPGVTAPPSLVTPQTAAPEGQNPQAVSGPVTTPVLGTSSNGASTITSAATSTTTLTPFGASLFTTSTPPSNMAPNPSYVIQPGDDVSIEMYGGQTAQVNSTVDSAGNVFLPSFGPVHVAGVTAGNLQATVQSQVSKSFTSNINVYAVLESEAAISVFVTGPVKAPGQYLGSSTDSVIDFLSRAGGVDPARGSYRDISIIRNGSVVQHIDLYDFLISGQGVSFPLEMGDTILVGKQEPMVAAGGSVRNNYLFELPDPASAGSAIIQLAQPLPSATNALVEGTRNGQPFSQYVTLNQLAQTPLYDQDQVTFIAGISAATITVQVQGSFLAPSAMVVPRDTTLKQVLDYISVDPTDADLKSIYIVRPGLAAQQFQSIQAAIDRLQKAVFYATSITTSESQIRASEATQIQTYINDARTIQPDGILVVEDVNDVMSDVRLEDGDTIVIPESSDTVMVEGEVQQPGAIRYTPQATRLNYIDQAGGFTERGKPGNVILRRASGLLVLDPNAAILPGDSIIVMPFIESGAFEITQDLVGLIYQMAAATYYAGKL
jgi:protein involved in polysaccharide export with SLBB domain